MNMAVDMLLAEAVVAGAFGAVTKLQIGILRIRFPADGALVAIEVGGLLPADLSARFAEVYGIRTLFIDAEHGKQIFPAEKEEV